MKLRLRLLDTSNLLPIKIMQPLNSIYALCLGDRRGVAKNEAKLLDTSDLLPIRIMHHPKTAVPFALRPSEAL
jgi:hypothetical protein